MIRSFADKETEKLYINGKNRKFPLAVCKVGLQKLDYLNAAATLEDLWKPPGNRLEALKGRYEGRFSIRINEQYRIIFKFTNSDSYDVTIEDYH